MSRVCGQTWQAMSDEQKKPWVDKAEKLKKQYQEEYENEVREEVQHRPERQEVHIDDEFARASGC